MERLIEEVIDEVDALTPTPLRYRDKLTPPPTPATIPAAAPLGDEHFAVPASLIPAKIDQDVGGLGTPLRNPSFRSKRAGSVESLAAGASLSGRSTVPASGPSFHSPAPASHEAPAPNPSLSAGPASGGLEAPAPNPSFGAGPASGRLKVPASTPSLGSGSARPLFPRAGESRTDVVDGEAAAIDHAVLRSVETGLRRRPDEPQASVRSSRPERDRGAGGRETGFVVGEADGRMKVVVGRPDESSPEDGSGLELAFEPRAGPPRPLRRRDAMEPVAPPPSIVRPVLIFAAVVVAGLVVLSIVRSCGG